MKYLILLLFLVGCSSANVDLIHVIDGDTFEYNNERIRLLDVYAPELNEEFGEEARIELTNLLYGKEIKLIGNETDKYNRSLRIVYANGINVNEEMKHFLK